MFTKKKKLKRLAGCAVALTLGATMLGGTLSASALTLDNKGKFYSDYNSLEEAKAAADELNVTISGEGNVLLKNDGMLPLSGSERVSVFGRGQDSLTGGSGSVTAALKEEGFIVNPALERFYAADSSAIGKEPKVNGASLTGSYELYSDAAVIVLSRTGGEGADAATVTTEVEDNKYGSKDMGWKHQALHTEGEGAEKKEYKHYLQLTDSEEEMIEYVKTHFKKVVVVVNTSNAMEMANLQDDDDINAILWIGRPGSTGLKALAKILNGKINPSGKLVDEWYRDFTADPTWYNFGGNAQVGSTNIYNYADGTLAGSSAGGVAGDKGYHGIDYEEDIYLGYKYYETVYAELVKDTIRYDATNKKLVAKSAITDSNYDAQMAADAWHDYAVVYPFGYGLSYSEFTQDLGDVYYINDGKNVNLGETTDGEIFASSKENGPAIAETLYAPVTVKNNGSVAGKQVVQVYVHAPYTAGGIEKADRVLVGYAKSDLLRPGQSQVVTVSFNVQDFASYDYNDANGSGYRGYELDLGDYSIQIMNDSHKEADHRNFTITGENAIALKLDDFSHNEVVPVFSNADEYNSLRINSLYSDSTHTDLQVNKNASDNMTLLKRTDMVGTFPKAPTVGDLTMTEKFVEAVEYFMQWDADGANGSTASRDEGGKYATEDQYPWYKTDAELKELMAGWTQHAAYTDGDYSDAKIKLRDMAGVDEKDEKWVEFLNQLSWDEIVDLLNHGSHTSYKVPSIDKTSTSDENGPNSYCGKSWCDENVVSATWNVELGRQYGIINANLGMFNNQQGWYGPGMNIHRSPFSGRNNEYYSEDGIQGGYMVAAVVSGAQSRGLNVYIKHMFLNDQETHRNQRCLFTWTSEAAIRSIYAKSFQMAMQEGGATSCMTAFARIGRVPASVNYNFLTSLVRDEWGWKGSYVTDAWAGLTCVTMDLAIRTGNDLPDGTASGIKGLSGTWDAAATGVGAAEKPSGTVKVGGETKTESLIQWYYARQCAQRVLYVAANTQNNANGVIATNYAAKSFDIQQGVALSNVSVAMAADDMNGQSATYAITKGTLPQGLSLNANTGAISGTTVVPAGTYKVTVTAYVSGWVKASAEITLNVASAFTLEGLEAKYNTGDEVEVFINSEVVTNSKYNQGITYELVDGALPAGVTVDGDSIVGTANEAGTFNATIKVTGTNVTTGRNGKTTIDEYLLNVTLVVESEAGVEPAASVRFRINDSKLQYSADGETWVDVASTSVAGVGISKIEKTGTAGLVDTYTITLTDGTTSTFTVTNGAQGAQGPAGEQGPAGSGCNGNIGATVATAGVAMMLVAAAAVVVRKKRQSK